MNPEINILFYSPTVRSTRYHKKTLSSREGAVQHIYLNTVPLYLNTFIKKNNPDLYSMIKWKHIILSITDQDDLVSLIERDNINVLCFSLYSWNHHDISAIMTGIKERIGREITIVVGGPSVDVARNGDFLLNHPDVDYAVFTDGEKPFHDILAHRFMGKTLSPLFTKNVAWMDAGKLKKAPYEFFVNTSDSPYLESEHLLQQIVDDPRNINATFELPYETSRGCPHGCTFCDWTSGMSHKSVKRKSNYEDELHLFGRLGIRFLYFADANFGLWPVDVLIAKKMAELKPLYDFETYTPNLSKTKKDRVFEIMDIFLTSGVVQICKFSVQDIDPVVLKNIDRPDIPWPEHKEYIRAIQKKHPNKIYKMEMIKGMPGQTRDSWANTLLEAYSLNLKPEAFNWIVLPNSPAGYDLEYRERMQLKTTRIERNLREEQVIGTYSFEPIDYAYFSVIEYLYRILHFMGVTPEEMKNVFTCTSPEWETDYLPAALENILLNGGLWHAAGNKIIHQIFDDHPLSRLYSERWNLYLENELQIHEGYIRADLL